MVTKKRACDASRRIVQDGLARRKLEKQLDAFEDQMLNRCNARCAEAKFDRRISRAVRMKNEKCMARIASRQKAQEEASKARKTKALWALSFFSLSVALFWLTEWTYLPVWAAWTFTAIMALFVPVLFWDIDRKKAASR